MKLKRKSRVIMGALATIALSAGAMAGATYALFTSDSQVDVTVKAGNVSVKTEVGAITTTSMGLPMEGGAWANGGSATVTGNLVTLDKITPGDSVSFPITVTNNSDVTVKYRTQIGASYDDGLWAGLEVQIGDAAVVQGLTAVSKWTTIAPDEGDGEYTVTVTLPVDAGNEYQGKSVTLYYLVEAVQANADVTDAAEGEIALYSAYDLLSFAKQVNAGNQYKGKTVSLMSDVDLEGVEWTPIGINADGENKFYGTFDGKSHTISNLTVDTTKSAEYRATGFFGALNGTLKNLNFYNATIKGLTAPNADGNTDNGIAVAAGSIYQSGAIDNVTVTKSTVSGNRYVAGIAGYVYGDVDNCTVTNTTITATPDKLTGSYDNGDKVGGIVGYLNDDTHTLTHNTVEGCTISAWRDVGGIGGCVGVDTHATFQYNTVSGNTISFVELSDYTKAHTNKGDLVGRNTGTAIDSTNEILD